MKAVSRRGRTFVGLVILAIAMLLIGISALPDVYAQTTDETVYSSTMLVKNLGNNIKGYLALSNTQGSVNTGVAGSSMTDDDTVDSDDDYDFTHDGNSFDVRGVQFGGSISTQNIRLILHPTDTVAADIPDRIILRRTVSGTLREATFDLPDNPTNHGCGKGPCWDYASTATQANINTWFFTLDAETTVVLQYTSPNNSPTASITTPSGPQTVNGGATVTLTGSGTDTEDDASSTALTYAWSQTGATGSFGSTSLASTTWTAPAATNSQQTTTLTLTVTDSGGATATDTVTITTSSQPNRPPEADAGSPRTVNGGVTITLDGRGSSDQDGQTLTYSWSHQSGDRGSFPSATNIPRPMWTAPSTTASGTTSTLLLTVSDGIETDTDTVTITTNANRAPTVDAGSPRTVNGGAVVTLTASGNDPDGQALTYSWAVTNGPAGSGLPSSQNPATWTAPAATNADQRTTFTVTVSDGIETDTDTVTITTNANRAPTVDAGSPRTVNGGAVVTLTASGNDPDGQALTYSWAVTNGPAGSGLPSSQNPATWTAPAATNADQRTTFTVTVSDGIETATDTVTITTNANRAPTVSVSADGTTVSGGAVVNLTGSGMDTDGQTLTYAWSQTGAPGSFGSATVSGNVARTTWTAPASTSGNQRTTLTLTVRDTLGATASDTVTITTSPAQPEAELTVSATDTGQTRIRVVVANADAGGTTVYGQYRRAYLQCSFQITIDTDNGSAHRGWLKGASRQFLPDESDIGKITPTVCTLPKRGALNSGNAVTVDVDGIVSLSGSPNITVVFKPTTDGVTRNNLAVADFPSQIVITYDNTRLVWNRSGSINTSTYMDYMDGAAVNYVPEGTHSQNDKNILFATNDRTIDATFLVQNVWLEAWTQLGQLDATPGKNVVEWFVPGWVGAEGQVEIAFDNAYATIVDRALFTPGIHDRVVAPAGRAIRQDDCSVESGVANPQAAYLGSVWILWGNGGAEYGYGGRNSYGACLSGHLPGSLFKDGQPREAGHIKLVDAPVNYYLSIAASDINALNHQIGTDLRWIRVQLRTTTNAIVATANLWDTTPIAGTCPANTICVKLHAYDDVFLHPNLEGQMVALDFANAATEGTVGGAEEGYAPGITFYATWHAHGVTEPPHEGPVSSYFCNTVVDEDEDDRCYISGDYPQSMIGDTADAVWKGSITLTNDRLTLTTSPDAPFVQKDDATGYIWERYEARIVDREGDLLAAVRLADNVISQSATSVTVSIPDKYSPIENLEDYNGQVLTVQLPNVYFQQLLERTPGGPIAGQFILIIVCGIFFMGLFMTRQSPVPEVAGIIGALLGAVAMPIFDVGNIFWTAGFFGLFAMAAISMAFIRRNS